MRAILKPKSPVKPGSHGVVISLSVLASDSRPKTPIFLHYSQAKSEARAGIEVRKSAFFNVLLGKNWLSAGDSIWSRNIVVSVGVRFSPQDSDLSALLAGEIGGAGSELNCENRLSSTSC